MSDQYEPIKEYWIIRVGEQAEEIKRLTTERDDLIRRLEPLLNTPTCCICGAAEPCMQESDLKPGDPGIPCTFDPTVRQLFDWNQTLLKRLVDMEGVRDKLTAERDAWRKLVMEHNTLRTAQCRNCREPCGDCCPAVYVLPIPPELEQPK